MRVDGARHRRELASPHRRHHVVARHHAIGMAEHQQRQFEFLGRERHHRAVTRGLVRHDVEGIAAPAQAVVVALARIGIDPSQQRLDARGQFHRPDRLDHVVVGAGVQRHRDIGLGLAPGHEHHRQAWVQVRAHPVQHLQSGYLWHVPVQQQQVECDLAQGQQHAAAVGKGHAFMAGAVHDGADHRRLGAVVLQGSHPQSCLRHASSRAPLRGPGE